MVKISLAAARKNVDLTQKEAADRIGISVATLHNYEKKKSFPNQKKLIRICEVYKIPLESLEC